MVIIEGVSRIMKDSRDAVKQPGHGPASSRGVVSRFSGPSPGVAAAQPRGLAGPGRMARATKSVRSYGGVLARGLRGPASRLSTESTAPHSPFSRTLIPLLLLLRTHSTSDTHRRPLEGRRMRARRRRGAAAIEVAMAVPILVLLLALAVGGGRDAGAQAEVDSAATNGAQAAALASDPGQALADAQSTVTVDTSDFQPGGTVSVTVTCSFSLSGIGFLGFTSTQLSETATAPLEPYRSLP